MKPDIVFTENAERYLSWVRQDEERPFFFLYPFLKGNTYGMDTSTAEALSAVLSFGRKPYTLFMDTLRDSEGYDLQLAKLARHLNLHLNHGLKRINHHVGTGKTGSSSIQRTLAESKEDLEQQGYAFVSRVVELYRSKQSLPVKPWQDNDGHPE